MAPGRAGGFGAVNLVRYTAAGRPGGNQFYYNRNRFPAQPGNAGSFWKGAGQ